jgi:hypothetical protein
MNKRWITVVMGAILVGVLVGAVTWARPGRSAQAADHLRRLTVPAAFFHPNLPGVDYANGGDQIWLYSGTGEFLAPVVFPCLPSVTVERVILTVDDQHGSANACVWMYRTKPSRRTEKLMASVCSSGSGAGVVDYIDDSIVYPEVWPSNGPYLWLAIYGTNINVYGVQIEYRRNI